MTTGAKNSLALDPFDWTCFKAWWSSSFRSLCRPQTLLTIYITPLPSHLVGAQLDRASASDLCHAEHHGFGGIRGDVPVAFYQYDSPCIVRFRCFILSASPQHRSSRRSLEAGKLNKRK